MIRPLPGVDPGALLRAWNRFYAPRYRIDAEILHDKSVGCPTFDWGASMAMEEGGDVVAGAVVKRSPAILYKGPDRDVAHLNGFFFDDVSAAVDLLAEIKSVLRARGVQCLDFGGDNGHIFPGCPTDLPRLHDFLVVQGFEDRGEAIDLERDLEGYEPPHPLPTDAVFRRLTEADRPELERFFEEEFPGRWCYDVLLMSRTRPIDESLMGVFEGDRMQGFVYLQDSGTPRPMGGAVWRLDLGIPWGALGPIGVSREVRGRGFGDGLLAAGLLDLRDRGCRQTIIDWTTLVDFYGRHGFAPSRRYRVMRLDLSRR